MNHKPGDEVTLNFEGDNRLFRVETITRHNTDAAPESEPDALAAQAESNPSETEPANASEDGPATPTV